MVTSLARFVNMMGFKTKKSTNRQGDVPWQEIAGGEQMEDGPCTPVETSNKGDKGT